MKYLRIGIFCLFVYMAAVVALPSCDSTSSRCGDSMTCRECPQDEDDSHEISEQDFDAEMRVRINKLKDAVGSDDAATVASLCRYPIDRLYPIHDIMDSTEMTERYGEIFDKKIKNAIISSKSDDWGGINWRGYTLEEGDWIWFDGDVYIIPYNSDYEKSLRNRLIKKDLASISPVLAKGWFPEISLLDSVSGTVYRIDLKELDSDFTDCRLMAYKDDFIPNADPSYIMYGRKELQGSGGTMCYVFPEEDSLQWTICNYWYENKIVLYVGKDDETIVSKDLKKVYWLDMIADK